MSDNEIKMLPHSSHWGVFSAGWKDGRLIVKPHPNDPDPNPLIENFPDAIHHKARVTRPMVRKGWLENGPGPSDKRGSDEFIPVPWERAIELVSNELARVKNQFGVSAIFGGSYGWSSAGRFHHAQSQVHRFLNTALGGYVRSVNSYSAGASAVILPYILGTQDEVARRNVTWEQIIEHTEVLLAFGGMALKNSRTASGGISRHIERQSMQAASKRGCKFISVSPLKSDMPQEANPVWTSIAPGTDSALMLGMLYVLISEKLYDTHFIERYCDGWQTFEKYVLGNIDGVPKTTKWASKICGIASEDITQLARSLVNKRVLIVVSHSLQRSEHGEQPVWMAAVLAAALGQIGLPGGGYNYALGTLAHYGKRTNAVPSAALPQGENGVKDFIPVARIADMLLNPGAPYTYKGENRKYPVIKLAYWAGGNPYHHHQDLNRLSRAFQKLDTFIVHEIAWTATARMADIVLPCTMTLERDDIGASPTDPLMVAMHRISTPHGEARDDYDIFADLAERLGTKDAFTEGRTSQQWLRHLYQKTQDGLIQKGLPAPDFDEFWARGEIMLPQQDDDGGILRAFHQDPMGAPLKTESGKIQISSPLIASYGYLDCPGYPAWLGPTEVPSKKFPLYLVANQPASKLHSQLDFGAHSMSQKENGREVCTIHPEDALLRGVASGDIIRIFNDRGACLASAKLSNEIRVGVIQLPTGAWYDPQVDAQGRTLCVHGNPNVLTRDQGTSSFAQGCAGQLTAVEFELFDQALPVIQAFDPP